MRRKNLLEAFRKSDASSAAAGPPARSEPPVPSRPTLFEGTAAPRSSGPGKEAIWALALVGLVIAFVLGFVVGRNTQGEALAGEVAPPASAAGLRPANQPRSFQERPAAATDQSAAPPAAGSSSGERRIEDSPLFDPANLYTVVVASYTKSNQDLAWATHEHLRDAKLPVFPPVESRNLVVVLAGAAPTSAELDRTEEAVKALSRDGKKKDYSDAYCARIDTLIPRPKKGTKP